MTYQKKHSLVTSIQRWVVLLLVILSTIMITVYIVNTLHSAEAQAKQVQTDFIQQQKARIKCEVDRVSKIINFQLARTTTSDEKMTRKKHDKATFFL